MRRWRLRLTIILVGTTLLGCGVAPDTAPDPSPSPAPSATQAEAGLSVISYLDNFLARAERADWTRDDGIEESLGMLVGAVNQDRVLLRRPIASRDLTGLIATGREAVAGVRDPDQKEDVEELLDLLVFESDQLNGMTLDPLLPPPTLPPRPTPTGPLPTVGSVEVESEPPVILPTFESDCQRFFRQFPVGEATRCLTAREGEAGELTYTVYAPAPSLATFGWQESHHALIDEALVETVAIYGELGSLPGEVTVVLAVNLDVASDAATIIDGDDCRIMVYTGAQYRSPAQFKQVIAQQMAHCFQAATFPEQQEASYAARRWREDGLAGYLSGLVYPEADLELGAIEPLTLIDRPTSLLDWSAGTVAWWNYVADDGGWPSIRSMVEAMPDEGDTGDQAAALAGLPGMDELFAGFAEAFSEGEILDGSGEAIATEWLPSFEEEEAAISESGVVLDETLPPFSLGHHLLVVPGNLRASLESSEGDGEIAVRTRLLSGSDWAPLPESFPSDCTSDVRLVILVTSVAAQPQDLRLSISEVTPSGC